MLTESVQCSTALRCSTQAGDLLFLDGEFVIIRNFFINLDVSLGIDNNLLVVFDSNYLCIAVWL